MRKHCMFVAAVVMIGSLSVLRAAEQGPGPQGAGAENTAQNSKVPRTYNPIKWIKKGPNTTVEKPKKAKSKKSSEKTPPPDALPPKG